jgi:crossover junction endodeoxyribonuclease RusA
LVADSAAAAVAARLRAGDWWGVYLDVFLETPRRRDLDNVLKPTVDAIASALDVPDSQLVDLHLSKHIDPLDPHVFVTVVALSDWTFDRHEFLVLAPGRDGDTGSS